MRCSPKDLDDVVRILTDDSVYEMVADDSVMGKLHAAKGVAATLNNISIYILKPNPSMIVIFTPVNHVTYEVHIATVAGEGRRIAVESALESFEWMTKNTACRKVFSMIPVDLYPQTGRFAEKCGLRLEGCLKKAYQKNGTLYDLSLYGGTAEEVLWAQ